MLLYTRRRTRLHGIINFIAPPRLMNRRKKRDSAETPAKRREETKDRTGRERKTSRSENRINERRTRLPAVEARCRSPSVIDSAPCQPPYIASKLPYGPLNPQTIAKKRHWRADRRTNAGRKGKRGAGTEKGEKKSET